MTVNTRYLKKPKKTTVMLHSADPKLTLNHVEWWLPILIESKVVFSILVRDRENFKKIKSKYPFIQILFAQSPVDVETVVNAQPNLKVVLYPSNRAKNIHLLRFIELRHIFVGTKNFDWLSKIDKSYRAYDEMWISGNAQYEKINSELDELRHLKLVKVGKPQIKSRFEVIGVEDSIAYLPSLENNEHSSFYKILHNLNNIPIKVIHEKISDKLINEYNVYKKNNDIEFIRDKNLFDKEIAESRAIICDLSRLNIWTFSDNKPIFLYLPKGEKFLHKDIPSDIITIFSDINELNLEENRTTKDKREKFVEDVFGKSYTLENKFIKKLTGEVDE